MLTSQQEQIARAAFENILDFIRNRPKRDNVESRLNVTILRGQVGELSTLLEDFHKQNCHEINLPEANDQQPELFPPDYFDYDPSNDCDPVDLYAGEYEQFHESQPEWME